MEKKDVQQWLDNLPTHATIGVDEGGLTLVGYWKDGKKQVAFSSIELGGLDERIEAIL